MGPTGNEAKSKMKHPSDKSTPEILTQVVVICGPTRYQLDHGSAPIDCYKDLGYEALWIRSIEEAIRGT